jgi:hypothetical protein
VYTPANSVKAGDQPKLYRIAADEKDL